MKSKGRGLRAGLWLLVALLMALGVVPRMPVHAATGVVIRDLGAPGANADSFAYDVNQLGSIAGAAFRFGNSFDILPLEWLGFRPIPLSKPAGTFGEAFGISDNNLAAGEVFGDTSDNATIWRGTSLKLLDNLPGGDSATGLDVNTSAIVIGYAFTADGDFHPVCWDAAGHIQDLGFFPGDVLGQARGVNNRTLIVGCAGPTPRATTWDHGVITRLQAFPRQVASCAESVNDRGVIGGWVVDEFFDSQAVIWQNGNVRPLPSADLAESEVLGINNRGQAVGDALDLDSGEFVGVLWNGAQAIELNDLLPPNSGWEFLSPQAINDQGVIVGYGFRTNIGFRAFALTVS